MRLYKRGGVWWMRTTIDGSTIRRSTRATSRAAAKAIADQWELDLADPINAAQDQAALSDAIEAFLERCQRSGKAPGTVNMYKTKCGHLNRLLPTRLKDIELAVTERYFDTRAGEGASGNTLLKEWIALRGVLKGAARRNVFRGDIDKLKPEWVRTDYVPRETNLTWVQSDKLLEHLDGWHRSAAAWMLATGSRFGETMLAKTGDLDRVTWVLRIHGTKTERSDRTIPVPEPMRPWLEGVSPPFPKWSNVTRDLRVACEKAGIPRVTPNDLRRTFASLLVQSGVPLDIVSRLLGHASTEMVYRIYGRHSPASLAQLASGSTVPLVYQDLRKQPDSVDPVETDTPQIPREMLFRRMDSNHDKRIQKLYASAKTSRNKHKHKAGVPLVYQTPKLYPLPLEIGKALWEASEE